MWARTLCPEHGVRERLDDGAFDLDGPFFFGHVLRASLIGSSGERSERAPEARGKHAGMRQHRTDIEVYVTDRENVKSEWIHEQANAVPTTPPCSQHGSGHGDSRDRVVGCGP
jgi:hypothetical protein